MAIPNGLPSPAASRHISLVVDSAVREKLAARGAKGRVIFFDVKAANVEIMDNVEIDPGEVLCPLVPLTSNIRIGQRFHGNLYSYLQRDCTIGDFVTFAPGVHCNVNVVVEDRAHVGSGAILCQGQPAGPLLIGRGAFVGMGAVVTRKVAPDVTVVGNPGRVTETCA